MIGEDIPVSATRYDAEGVLAQLIALALQTTQQLSYIQISVLTLLIMNIVTTFDVELERIWKAKQNKITVVFYIVRYLPPLCTGFAIWGGQNYDIKYWGDACKIWFWMEAMMCMVVVQAMAEFLMITRVWALYNFNRRMLIFLCLILLGRFTISLWGGVMVLPSLTFAKLPRSMLPIPGCPIIPSAETFKHVYVLKFACIYNIVATGIIFICLLRQCIARNPLDQRILGTWRDLIGIRSAQPLIHVLLRDGNAYFLVIFCAELVLLIASSGKDPFVALYTLPFIQAAYAIPATRLVLNLRHSSHIQNDIILDEFAVVEFAPRHAIDPEYISQHMDFVTA